MTGLIFEIEPVKTNFWKPRDFEESFQKGKNNYIQPTKHCIYAGRHRHLRQLRLRKVEPHPGIRWVGRKD
jgi:hypothetical protein